MSSTKKPTSTRAQKSRALTPTKPKRRPKAPATYNGSKIEADVILWRIHNAREDEGEAIAQVMLNKGRDDRAHKLWKQYERAQTLALAALRELRNVYLERAQAEGDSHADPEPG